MFVRPSRRAHALIPPGGQEGGFKRPRKAGDIYELLIDEMNFYHQLGEGAFYAYKE